MVGRGCVLGSARPRVECCQPRRILFTTGWQVGYLALDSRGDSLISIEELRKWDIVVVIRL